MKYADIVFIQSADETAEPERIFNENGAEALFNYLKQWDYGESPIVESDKEPWGSRDLLYTFDGGYVMGVNLGLPTFGLIQKVE